MNTNEHVRSTLPQLANQPPVNLNSRRAPSISDLKLTSPMHARQPSYGYAGGYTGAPNGMHYHNMPPRHQEDHYAHGGSDLKRRRYTNGAAFGPVLPEHQPGPRYSISSPLRDRFGNPVEPPRYAHSAAVPVPVPVPAAQQHVQRPLDRSLTLAPALSPANSNFSMESVHMSVSVLGKIRVLGRISPPYKTQKSSGTKGDNQFRGLIIAIEGDNESALSSLVTFLRDQLNSEDDLFVKVSHGPTLDQQDGPLTISHSHQLMITWRQKSQEMIDFITALPSQTEKKNVRTVLGKDTKYESATRLGINYCDDYDDYDDDNDDSRSQVSPKDTSRTINAPSESRESIDVAMENSSTEAKVARKPVLLMHHYQLHATNVYASMTEVDDQYSAVDHWQWMATLWRGTVGPDVTIYLKDCGADEMAREPPIVEVREDVRSVIVRREKEGPRGVVQDRTLRRLRFEISELVRAGGFQNRPYGHGQGQMAGAGQGQGDERQGVHLAANPRSRSS